MLRDQYPHTTESIDVMAYVLLYRTHPTAFVQFRVILLAKYICTTTVGCPPLKRIKIVNARNEINGLIHKFK